MGAVNGPDEADRTSTDPSPGGDRAGPGARPAGTRPDHWFERVLDASRLLVLIPVVVLDLSALAAFVYGTGVFVHSVGVVLNHPIPVGHKIGLFLLDIDLFLIGATLLIASIGLYELFVGRVGNGGHSHMPEWLQMDDLNDLKGRVVAMIVLVVSVAFVEVVVDFDRSRTVLEVGGGVALVVAALTLFLRFGNQPHPDR